MTVPKPRNPEAIGDIKLRNGKIVRNVMARKWRFGVHPEVGESEFDIVGWWEIGK